MKSVHGSLLLSADGNQFLICSAACPFVTDTELSEEALLYNLSNSEVEKVRAGFYECFNQRLAFDHDLTKLSGGQKVVLMVLMALCSPAQRIFFTGIESALDRQRREFVWELILSSPKTVVVADGNAWLN